MKIVKIKFVDFWEHWNQEDNFIVNTLKKFFKVEFSENPDYVFYSNFSKRLDHMKYKNAVKIFYTQENLCPDFNFADYGIGFEELTYGDSTAAVKQKNTVRISVRSSTTIPLLFFIVLFPS